MGIYIVLLLIIAAAIPLTVALKREGERSWAAHQRRVQAAQLRVGLLSIQIELRDNFSPKMQEVGLAAAKCAREMRHLAEAMKVADDA